MFDNGEIECSLLGAFGKSSGVIHEVKNGKDTSAKLEGYVGGVGGKVKKDLTNGNGGITFVDGVGGGFSIESKKDSN